MTEHWQTTEKTAAQTLQVGFAWLDPEGSADLLVLPAYATALAAGMDVAACIDAPVTLAPGDIRLIGCGFAVAIPAGFKIKVRPRSGPGGAPRGHRGQRAGHHRCRLPRRGAHRPDQPGARKAAAVRRGDRIAQLVLAPVVQAALEVQGSLAPTRQGDGSFGSTGLR